MVANPPPQPRGLSDRPALALKCEMDQSSSTAHHGHFRRVVGRLARLLHFLDAPRSSSFLPFLPCKLLEELTMALILGITTFLLQAHVCPIRRDHCTLCDASTRVVMSFCAQACMALSRKNSLFSGSGSKPWSPAPRPSFVAVASDASLMEHHAQSRNSHQWCHRISQRQWRHGVYG